MTPLHVEAEKGDRLEIVKYLCEKGADISIKDCSGVSEIMNRDPSPLFMYYTSQDDGQIFLKIQTYGSD